MKDKMMARFQTERNRKIRNASTFALHDSDSDQDEHDNAPFLTRRWAKITDDDYDILTVNRLLDDEDDSKEGRKMDRDIVSKLHVGGGKDDVDAPEIEEEKGKRKTYKELMQAVKLKAKLYKAKRKRNKTRRKMLHNKRAKVFAS